MKTLNVNVITLLLAVCICFASCSSEETNEVRKTEDIQKAYEELNANLAIYNTDFMNKNALPQTKAKFWKKLARFLCADASGALIGGSFGGGVGAIFGAIFSSATAGPAMAATKALSTTVEVNAYATASEEGIGYLHNQILSEIEAEHPGIYNQAVSSEVMANLIIAKMQKYGYVISETNKNALIKKAENVMPKTDFDTMEQLSAHYKKVLPEFSNEFNIIQDFVLNVEDISDDTNLVKEYSTGYQLVISSSKLPEPKKLELLPCIDVAANSAVLWEVDE